MSNDSPPSRHVLFDSPPEIFATDSQGAFGYPLLVAGKATLATSTFDEMRFLVSIWHPSGKRSIDLDRAYVELCGSFDPQEEHWTKLAEVEPVVSPYGSETFDGWIVLPIFSNHSAFAVMGSGFDPRARLQIRASAYFVA